MFELIRNILTVLCLASFSVYFLFLLKNQ